jgi:hypothetical protein
MIHQCEDKLMLFFGFIMPNEYNEWKCLLNTNGEQYIVELRNDYNALYVISNAYRHPKNFFREMILSTLKT